MERGEVRHGVGNGLDRGRGDIVVYGVDMPARDVLAFKCYCCCLRRCQDGTPPVVSSNTVLLAAERGLAITTIMAMTK